MKKWIIFLVLLLLILTACQTVPSSETEPAGSTPSSSSITPPSSSVVPATSVPVTTPPATNVPTTNPPQVVEDGRAFIYYGPQIVVLSPNWRPTEALVNHLYWVVRSTKQCTLICDEPVAVYTATDTHVYFVKADEPSKIYRTLIGAFSQHELIHETAHGKVGDMTIYPGIENYLQFVADNKKFVVFEFDTGVETVLMEQYYIGIAYIAGENGVLGNWIWFEGKHKETDNSPYNQYFYYRDTGETKNDPYL